MSTPLTQSEVHRMCQLLDTPVPQTFTDKILAKLDEHFHFCPGCRARIRCRQEMCGELPDAKIVCDQCQDMSR